MSPFRSSVKSNHVREVASLLKERYRDFSHFNKKNPLDELLFIICSITTTEPVYRRTHRALKKRFRSFSALSRASVAQIAKAIREGGQYRQKGKAIRRLLAEIVRRYGKPTLSPLKGLSNGECESFLLSLSGVGKKVARCVMLYSLKREVFPVDTHCRRVCSRLGWRGTAKDDDVNDDQLQAMVPGSLRYSLHVNMISLGREFCKAKKPICHLCPLKEICPKLGTEDQNLLRKK